MGDLKLVRINRVQLSGRVTRDLITRYAPGGTPVVTFSLAFNRWVKNEDGSWKEIPSFINILASGRLAERCGEHLHKGSPVYLEGRLQSRKYKTRDGKSQSVIEIRAEAIQFLERDETPEEVQPHIEPPRSGKSKQPEVHEGELFPVSDVEEGEE